MTNSTYLGVSGKVSHREDLVQRYNNLLDFLGESGMLTQIERWADDEDLESIILHAELFLKEPF